MPTESSSPVAIGTFLMDATTPIYLNDEKLTLKI